MALMSGSPAFAATNQSSTISPNYVAANPGLVFDNITTNQINYFIEQSHSPVYFNNTSSSSPYVWQRSASVSKSYSASATLSGGWGPVNYGLGLTANTSVSHTYTYEATLTVPAHQYGWYKFGYAQDKWYGHYYYLNTNGSESNSNWVYVYSPRYAEFSGNTSTSQPSNP